MKVLTKISYNSVFAIWKTVSIIAELLYRVVCAIDAYMVEKDI